MKERKDLSAYLFFEFVLYFKNTLFNTNCYNLNNYKKPSRKTWLFLKLDTLLFKSNNLLILFSPSISGLIPQFSTLAGIW